VSPAGGRAAAGTPSVLRRMNSALILDVIRRDGPLSRADIARASGLSKPTVNEVVELLLAGPYVEEAAAPAGGDGAGDRPRRPGPRARLLRFRADVAHVLGIDVGAAKLVVDVADLSGRVVASERRPLSARARAGHAAVLREVSAAARAALRGAGIDAGALRAAGVGTPGVVAPDTGRITLAPQLEVFGVQAAGASAIHDSWHSRTRLTTQRADTFAEGVATRTTYDLTFPALQSGLAGFVTVTDSEIAEALRTIVATTHNLVEGAGAMGFAALPKLADRLEGKNVGIIFCGGNIDVAMLERVLRREI